MYAAQTPRNRYPGSHWGEDPSCCCLPGVQEPRGKAGAGGLWCCSIHMLDAWHWSVAFPLRHHDWDRFRAFPPPAEATLLPWWLPALRSSCGGVQVPVARLVEQPWRCAARWCGACGRLGVLLPAPGPHGPAAGRCLYEAQSGRWHRAPGSLRVAAQVLSGRRWATGLGGAVRSMEELAQMHRPSRAPTGLPRAAAFPQST